MRTIDEIKDAIAADFMNREEIAEIYGFAPGEDFSKHFSKVSFINILFYIMAVATWVTEKLHQDYKDEIEARIDAIIPHRLKWYRDKTLQFMPDRELIPDTDRYDTSDMTEDEVEAARPVKAAVAIESSDASLLTIKVKGTDGELDPDTAEKLEWYLNEIKDAGVPIHLVSKPGDVFDCTVDVYYNPVMTEDTVRDNCEEAIRTFIQNLPFNGEYTNMGLVDELQKIEGVRIAEVKQAQYLPDYAVLPLEINARCVPDAGWFRPGDIQVNMIIHE
ncbi:MAG: hypothetical protein LUF04_16155 [Bacteroides sp.]|nr:hypothetical protein [Bacteroides sp.]